MDGSLSPIPTSTKLQRIRKLAKEMPDAVLTTLAYHLDEQFLHDAFKRIRKDGAPGIDGESVDGYAINLEENLKSLLNRAKSGSYKAPAAKRVRIPKGDGKQTRPIGIPTVEDKVLQKAVSMILGVIYEEEFLDCSYGFRPKRSAHQALETLWRGTNRRGGWVVEADIKGFYDNINHTHLREILGQRVRDGVITRLIGKWLKAGVLENGQLSYPGQGTPQGGVISPLLGNIFLHHILDSWWAKEIKPLLRGDGLLIRYADDFVMVFESKRDAEKMMNVLPKRFGKYGLELHPDKTRMFDFRKPYKTKPTQKQNILDNLIKRESFDFLGFTHYWALSRKGKMTVRRKTAKSRLKRTLKRTNLWLRRVRHLPVWWQHKKLSRSLVGHYAYFGITGNIQSLGKIRYLIERLWRKWLGRRSNRSKMTWEKFTRLSLRYPLPQPRIYNSPVGLKP